MSELPPPESWPAEEPCSECGGTGKVRAEVRRTSADEPHEVEHRCPVCGGKVAANLARPANA